MHIRWNTVLGSAIACSAFVGVISRADAVTLTVCKQGCEYSLISAAVAAAAAGDTISIGKGTFHENVVLADKNLTLTGSGEDYTVIDGGYLGSVLTINGTSPAKSKVTISKLTVLHGSASGISASESTLSLQKVIVISNIPVTGGNGAGIATSHSVVNISSSIIAHNSAATGLGGGIYAGSSESGGSVFTITSSDIFDNAASEGGGLYIDSNSAATLNTSTVTSNTAKNGGGASLGSYRRIAYARIGFLTLNSSTMANNSASESGGALYVPIEDNGGSFSHSLVVGNKAGVQGGAIYFAEDGSVDLSNTVFAGNQPDNCFGGATCP